jgi:cbb3-type cytochrome oxidase maturation protein
MEILYLLVLLALILVAVIVWAYFWSIKTGQFDDLEGPAHRIIMDRDDPPMSAPEKDSAKTRKPND